MLLEEKREESARVNKRFSRWRSVNKHVDRIILAVLLFMIAFVGSALVDNWMFIERGIEGVKYHSFDELLSINPDTVAWLTIDGTHIDNPVVRTDDNFEYLDKAFTGEFFAGGTLFLDYNNHGSFEDAYNIIHGHNMTAGVMFGDLEKFLDEDFFEENQEGTLLTPEYDYDLQIAGAGIYDAYDTAVYTVGEHVPVKKIMKETTIRRPFDVMEAEQILALSTCTGDMNDDRVVVFFRMMNKRKHK